MKTKSKLLIDRSLGIPLAWAMNLGARFLGFLLRRDHSADPARVRTIVVAKILGMGSIVHSGPMLAGLRERFPQARILFLTAGSNRALVERLPMVDGGIYIDDRSVPGLLASTLKAMALLIRSRVDLYFDLEVYSASASILALCSLARNRYGLYRHSARFKKGIYTHLIYFNTRNAVARIYLQLLHSAGGTGDFTGTLVPIEVLPEEKARVAAKLAAWGLPAGSPYVLVNPNASDLLVERRWPAERFCEVLEAMARPGLHWVLVGTGEERAYVEALRERLTPECRDAVLNTAGRLGLHEFIALVQGAAVVLTNDTGPMHLAGALGKPTVCLFGPGSPEHYGIHGDQVEVVRCPVACSPCIYETDAPPCAGNNVCMQLIRPERVVASLKRFLGDAPNPGAGSHPPVAFLDQEGQVLGLLARPDRPRGQGRAPR